MAEVFSLTPHWNDEQWSHVPWKQHLAWATQLEKMPTYFAAEYVFIFNSILAFIHACRSGRQHTALWIASVAAGIVYNLYVTHPLVDTIWHCQATIMLTPRIPLYICCVYNNLLYWSTAAAWNMQVNIFGKSFLAGVLGILFYAGYDIIGARFVWWTWHASDASTKERLYGVPFASALSVIIFSFLFFLSVTTVHGKPFLIVPAGYFSVFLLVPAQFLITVLFSDNPGIPNQTCLQYTLVLSGIWYFRLCYPVPFSDNLTKKMGEWYQRTTYPSPRSSWWMFQIVCAIHYGFLIQCTLIGNPEKHVCTGIHQKYKLKQKFEMDISGTFLQWYRDWKGEDLENYRRARFVNPETLQEGSAGVSYAFCGEKPSSKFRGDWYDVCGHPMSRDERQEIICILLSLFFIACVCYHHTFHYPRSTWRPKDLGDDDRYVNGKEKTGEEKEKTEAEKKVD